MRGILNGAHCPQVSIADENLAPNGSIPEPPSRAAASKQLPLMERPKTLAGSANSMDLGSSLQWTKDADAERLDSNAQASTSGFAVSPFLLRNFSENFNYTGIGIVQILELVVDQQLKDYGMKDMASPYLGSLKVFRT